MTVFSDKEFLDDYLSFGIWQPAVFSAWLVNQTPERGGFGKTVGLQLYINQYQALEALTMWYFALKNWHPGKKSLTSTFPQRR